MAGETPAQNPVADHLLTDLRLYVDQHIKAHPTCSCNLVALAERIRVALTAQQTEVPRG